MKFITNVLMVAKNRLRKVAEIRKAGFSLVNAAGLGVAVLLSSVSIGTVLCMDIHKLNNATLITIPSELPAGVEPVAMPHVESFDEYPTNFSFSYPTNGWGSELGNESSVVAVSSLPVTPPAPLDFSERCLHLDTQGETFPLVATGQVDNVWIDLSMLMLDSDSLPSLPTKSQLGLRMLSVIDEIDNTRLSHHLVVACGITNGWMASSQILPNNDWEPFQVTIQIAYADRLTIPYFRVFLNQTNMIWSSGFTLPDVPSEEGGAWLPCMTTNRAFYGIAFSGIGYVDEIRISDSNLGPVVPYQTNLGQAVAITWASDYGQSYQVETCTNLSDHVWEPFGDPVVGNGTTNTVFEDMGSSIRKFYRVIPLQ